MGASWGRLIVVLLSPAYFTRLWCVYECYYFLAQHIVDRMALLLGVLDQLTVASHRMRDAPSAVRALASAMPCALRFQCRVQLLKLTVPYCVIASRSST